MRSNPDSHVQNGHVCGCGNSGCLIRGSRVENVENGRFSACPWAGEKVLVEFVFGSYMFFLADMHASIRALKCAHEEGKDHFDTDTHSHAHVLSETDTHIPN